MNKKVLLLGVIIGICVCYGIFMVFYAVKPNDKVPETKTYSYVLLNKDLKKYDRVTSNDIVEINTQDDKLGEIKLKKQINSDLLDISSNETYYISDNMFRHTILQDVYLLTYDEVISKRKEEFQNSNKMIFEIESMKKKEQEGFEVDENQIASYENILHSFDLSKDISVVVSSDERKANAKLIEINTEHALVALEEDDYEYFQNIKDTNLISVKLSYN